MKEKMKGREKEKMKEREKERGKEREKDERTQSYCLRFNFF